MSAARTVILSPSPASLYIAFGDWCCRWKVKDRQREIGPRLRQRDGDASRSAPDVHAPAVAREFSTRCERAPGRERLGVQSEIVRVALLGGHFGIDPRGFGDTRTNRVRGSEDPLAAAPVRRVP